LHLTAWKSILWLKLSVIFSKDFPTLPSVIASTMAAAQFDVVHYFPSIDSSQSGRIWLRPKNFSLLWRTSKRQGEQIHQPIGKFAIIQAHQQPEHISSSLIDAAEEVSAAIVKKEVQRRANWTRDQVNVLITAHRSWNQELRVNYGQLAEQILGENRHWGYSVKQIRDKLLALFSKTLTKMQQ